ncbi:uncharacterized protein LOC132307674 [Cornus florida]|uniref:uncharacterized protein LOC132307674 n=1 Tax=Cornus florida TaxID=4283 RepID=UPI00289B283F|nr:uncharacterized protein LOC132307674 [Cornus florida]
MGWQWKKEYLDVVLVPIGLLNMFGYHLFLLYRVLKHPDRTMIGYENNSKKAWVERTMQVEAKERGLALQVINSNMSAASSLSSICLVLSSLIGAWIGSSSENVFTSDLIYGDTSSSIISIKYMTLLSFFLVAFASFVQTTRNLVHACFLITMPNTEIPVSYVEKAVLRGSYYWSIGMRALYFATTLLLWIFGPIPMFVSSVILVAVLHNLDTNSTLLHTFQPSPSHNRFQKNGKERTSIRRVTEGHERPPAHGYQDITGEGVRTDQNLELQEFTLSDR